MGISVSLNVIFIAAVAFVLLNPGVFVRPIMDGIRAQRAEVFDSFPISEGDVVFLGDSITHLAPWEEMFPAYPTRNRGIASDTTIDILARLEPVIAGKPRAIFLKIGTNDLTLQEEDPQAAYRRYQEIIERIRASSPTTKIVLQSLLPRALHFQDNIEAFNVWIRQLADEMSLTYVELYPHFLAEDGSIRDEFTYDELHLNGLGNQKWREVLKPYLESL